MNTDVQAGCRETAEVTTASGRNDPCHWTVITGLSPPSAHCQYLRLLTSPNPLFRLEASLHIYMYLEGVHSPHDSRPVRLISCPKPHYELPFTSSDGLDTGGGSQGSLYKGGCAELSDERFESLASLQISEQFGMALLPFLVACITAVTVVTAASSSQFPFQPLPDLFSLTVDDIITGFATNQFTSADLVSAYIARTAEVQQALRPVIEINPDALLIAQTLDNERLIQNRTRGPLHGVPVLLKDNIGTADQLNTTAGSYALYGSIVPHDATVAANLRAAGAVILGKAGLSEWAFWRGTNNSNGWSARGGQVKGAYYEDQDPSGSSGGSAVAAGLGLTALAVGTDTGGSIIDPANINGVVGIRPSTGLTSRSVVVPITVVQDSVGPITRTVKDAAYLLSAMAGPKGDPGGTFVRCVVDSVRFDRRGLVALTLQTRQLHERHPFHHNPGLRLLLHRLWTPGRQAWHPPQHLPSLNQLHRIRYPANRRLQRHPPAPCLSRRQYHRQRRLPGDRRLQHRSPIHLGAGHRLQARFPGVHVAVEVQPYWY